MKIRVTIPAKAGIQGGAGQGAVGATLVVALGPGAGAHKGRPYGWAWLARARAGCAYENGLSANIVGAVRGACLISRC